jgi:long-chain acyl-CoA synthetase
LRQTITSYLEDFAARGTEIAYAHRRGYRTERWTYAETASYSHRFAAELEAGGIRKGEKVLLWGENCAEWVVAFLGSVLRGAVVVPMDRIAAPDFAMRVARQVDARLCVCSREQKAHLGGMPSLVLEELREYLSGRESAGTASVEAGRDDPIEIVFTSGTTAEPKGVVLSHRNVLANLEPLETEIRKYLKYERIFHPLRFLNLLPLSHVFGQFLGIFIPQLLGATVLFQDSLNPSEIIRTIKRERVSVLVGVPRLLETLRDKLRRDFESVGKPGSFEKEFAGAEGEHFVKRWWRFRKVHSQFGWKFWAFISGGAALDSDAELFWSRLSFVVIQGYGLTETTSLVSVNHPFKLGRGSIGKVLPGREIKLDASGEILVRGDNIASSYTRGGESVPVLGDEGWFHTGDVGEFDQNGNLYFKGRKKNVIVTPEGMNIYPEDLESALRRQPEVRDCIVFGLERDRNAEPYAVLILHGGEADAAVRRANESLADFQQIRRWEVWPDEDFPRTSTQKPRLNVIEEYVRSKLDGTGDVAAPQAGSLSDLLQRITARRYPRIDDGTKLAEELSLTSIERVELLSALEDRYQTDLNESRFTAATTVGDLERMLRRPDARRSDYRYPRWARTWLVTAIRLAVYYLVSWPATYLMSMPRVRGRENLSGVRGPLLIVSNHITQVDIGFILAALPARIRHRLAIAMLGEMLEAMRTPPARVGLVRRWIEKMSYYLVVALFNVFPLPQQTGFRESFAYAGESADRGYSILVFPEGRRTQDGRLSPFRSGIGLLARSLNLPVVTIRIDGLFELKKAGKKIAPGAVTVTIGTPRVIPADLGAEEITRELELEMASLAAGPSAGHG